MEISNIIEYLQHRDYLVTVTNTDHGCIASFPAQQLLMHSSEVYKIEFIIDWTTGKVVVDNLDSHRTYEFPLYLISIFVLYSISYCCGICNYNTDLICFEIDGRSVDEDYWLKQCLGCNLNTEQNEKSIALLNIMLKIQEGNSADKYVKIAEEKGVLKGYELIKTWVEIPKDA